MIRLNDKKDAKLGDSFYDIKKNEWYYFDGLNWVLPLIFTYKNYKGSVSERTVLPLSIFYGITDFHKTPCWLMHGWDIDKKQYRDFCMVDVVSFL